MSLEETGVGRVNPIDCVVPIVGIRDARKVNSLLCITPSEDNIKALQSVRATPSLTGNKNLSRGCRDRMERFHCLYDVLTSDYPVFILPLPVI